VLRAIVVATPFIALVLRRTPRTRLPAAIFIGLIALNVVLVPVRKNGYAWGALTRSAESGVDGYVASPDFVPGATYRILRVGDGKVGMYDIVRNGGRLDSEPFPESIDRRSWATAAEYVSFLKRRHVNFVIIYDAYDDRYRTNEHQILEELTGRHGSTACSTRISDEETFDVYELHIDQCEQLLAPAGS
jgi:hypothetical protein